MTDTSREALIKRMRERIAYLLDVGVNDTPVLLKEAADMLEADATELTRLRDLARDAANAATQLQKQVLALKTQQVAAPVPLSHEQIIEIAIASKGAEPGNDGYILPFTFARAIEAHHGIGAKP